LTTERRFNEKAKEKKTLLNSFRGEKWVFEGPLKSIIAKERGKRWSRGRDSGIMIRR